MSTPKWQVVQRHSGDSRGVMYFVFNASQGIYSDAGGFEYHDEAREHAWTLNRYEEEEKEQS